MEGTPLESAVHAVVDDTGWDLPGADPEQSIGTILKHQAEADAVRPVMAAVCRVSDRQGPTAPDAAWFADEEWPLVRRLEQPSLIDGIRQEAVAVREFSTGVGPTDLVVVDTDGTITVVECKLARNQEIRRTIMGQVLDYAARLAELTPEDFQRQWSAQNGPSLDQLFEGSPDGRENLAANLRAGVFALVLAVDAINDHFRRIVRYLNTHTTAGMRLLAIELRRAVHVTGLNGRPDQPSRRRAGAASPGRGNLAA